MNARIIALTHQIPIGMTSSSSIAKKIVKSRNTTEALNLTGKLMLMMLFLIIFFLCLPGYNANTIVMDVAITSICLLIAVIGCCLASLEYTNSCIKASEKLVKLAYFLYPNITPGYGDPVHVMFSKSHQELCEDAKHALKTIVRPLLELETTGHKSGHAHEAIKLRIEEYFELCEEADIAPSKNQLFNDTELQTVRAKLAKVLGQSDVEAEMLH